MDWHINRPNVSAVIRLANQEGSPLNEKELGNFITNLINSLLNTVEPNEIKADIQTDCEETHSTKLLK